MSACFEQEFFDQVAAGKKQDMLYFFSGFGSQAPGGLKLLEGWG